MRRKHKPKPEPPKWYFYDEDDCWACKNRNACGSCKRLKKFRRKHRDKLIQLKIKLEELRKKGEQNNDD